MKQTYPHLEDAISFLLYLHHQGSIRKRRTDYSRCFYSCWALNLHSKDVKCYCQLCHHLPMLYWTSCWINSGFIFCLWNRFDGTSSYDLLLLLHCKFYRQEWSSKLPICGASDL